MDAIAYTYGIYCDVVFLYEQNRGLALIKSSQENNRKH